MKTDLKKNKKIKIDYDVDASWISEPKPNINDVITFNEANLFIENFFELFDAVIFDPDFKTSERQKAKLNTIQNLKKENSITREMALKTLNQELKKMSISHVAALDPSKTEFLIKMTTPQNENNENSVSAQMINDFGVIKVPTFLIPGITLKQVEDARNKTKNAKYLIYDLRNNGGGSSSSMSYLIETILGPNTTLKFAKTRLGLSITKPFVFDSYFEDKENFGSEKDIELEKEKKFVEWRTRKEAVKDNRKTFVLINNKSASSADMFAMAIKEHKAATLIGKTTAGAVLSGILFKLDWKGFTAILPISQVISPNGILYEGIGIAPDYELESCESTDDKCIYEIIELIKNKKADFLAKIGLY